MPELPSPLSGNALVCSAVALGWQVADLFHLHSPPDKDPKPGVLLPERSDFSVGTQANWLAGAIATRVEALLPGQFSQQPPPANQQPPPAKQQPPPAKQQPPPAKQQPPPANLQEQLAALQAAKTNVPKVPTKDVFKLHARLLDDLGAADVRLGKAYSLGQTLAELALTVDNNWAIFTGTSTYDRIANARAWLYDLKALLPDHTAYAVERSLKDLEEWLPDATRPAREAGQRQGQIWRELLTGEKPATSLLSEADYQAATRRVAIRVARRYWWLVVCVVGAVGAAILIAYAVQKTFGKSQVYGSIGALVSVLGISLAGTGAVVGKAVKNVDSWLWQAELDQATALAAIELPKSHRPSRRKDIGTIRLSLPQSPKASEQTPKRRSWAWNSRARKAGVPARSSFQTWEVSY
jgi:hypothetical protein